MEEGGEMGRPPRPDEMPRPQDVHELYGAAHSPHSPSKSPKTYKSSSSDNEDEFSRIAQYRARPIMQQESSSAEDSGADDVFEDDED